MIRPDLGSGKPFDRPQHRLFDEPEFGDTRTDAHERHAALTTVATLLAALQEQRQQTADLEETRGWYEDGRQLTEEEAVEAANHLARLRATTRANLNQESREIGGHESE